jgi:hypothetical protein
VHQAVTITQLLGKLAVAMPNAVSAMKIARHFPAFRVGLTVTVIKPFYVKLWLHSENQKIARSFCTGTGQFILPAGSKFLRVFQKDRLIRWQRRI